MNATIDKYIANEVIEILSDDPKDLTVTNGKALSAHSTPQDELMKKALAAIGGKLKV